jgi:hypothetical protein
MPEFVFNARLSVHAASEAEAAHLAREARDFLNDPVLFGCLFSPGGGIAPPHLRLLDETPSIEPPGGSAR